MPVQRSSRGAAEAQYRLVRLAALKAAEALAAETLAAPVRLTLIGPDALDAHRTDWVGHSRRRYSWPWDDMAAEFRRGEPSRFEVAVWSEDVLCGLALGRTRSEHCRVDYLEGSPKADHPLRGKVAIVTFTAAVAYATALGRREMRLMDPVPDVVPHYVRLGFVLVNERGSAPYCVWNIT